MSGSDPVFQATNPDGSDPGIAGDFLSWQLTQFLDKEWQFDAEASAEIPLIEAGWLDISVKGQIIFRGFLDEKDPTGDGKIRLTYYDLRKSLEDVYCQILEYPAGCAINQMLASDPPTGGAKPGLLFLANSLVPQGNFKLYSGEVYKLSGMGTSNLRGGSAAIYQESTLLTLGASAATLARGQYFRDSSDLFIRCTDGRDPKYFCISIQNFKDTRIRLGTITNGTFAFTVPYRIRSKNNFRDLLFPLLTALSLEPQLEHRAPVAGATMGYSYLNGLTSVGKGSTSSPVDYFGDSSLSGGAMLVSEKTTGGGIYNSIIGAGPGSGNSQIVDAVSNYAALGHWKEKIYSTSLLGEMLSGSLATLWGDQLDPRCWQVRDVDSLSRLPGDYVEFTSKKSQPQVKRIKKIVHSSDGTMQLEINQRKLEPEDEMRSRSQVIGDLQAYISQTVTSWSASFGPQNLDDATSPITEWGGEARFTVNLPANSIDQEFPYKFFLSFDIVPFESATESVDTDAHNNGGATGGHAGYGGNPTSQKVQASHGVNSFTGQSANSQVDCITTIFSGGGHGHSFTNAGAWRRGENIKDELLDVYIYEYYLSAIAQAANHPHTGASFAVSQALHIHSIPSHTTNTADAQSHDTAHESSKVRAVYTEPIRPATVTSFKKKFDSGLSPHYLDVTVKVNGAQIAGSPFPSLYIGDGEEVDVSSLIANGDNIIEFGIKDHTNPLVPVRCGVRGSISATYYLYPFA